MTKRISTERQTRKLDRLDICERHKDGDMNIERHKGEKDRMTGQNR